MDKLQMAHEYAINHMNSLEEDDPIVLVSKAWKYADAMQAEWDSRINKDRPTVLHDEFQPTGYETPTEEWQPDWNQAPSLATHWSMTDYGTAKWHSVSTKPLRDCGCAFGVENSLEWSAPTFGYQGDWKDSLRERP